MERMVSLARCVNASLLTQQNSNKLFRMDKNGRQMSVGALSSWGSRVYLCDWTFAVATCPLVASWGARLLCMFLEVNLFRHDAAKSRFCLTLVRTPTEPEPGKQQACTLDGVLRWCKVSWSSTHWLRAFSRASTRPAVLETRVAKASLRTSSVNPWAVPIREIKVHYMCKHLHPSPEMRYSRESAVHVVSTTSHSHGRKTHAHPHHCTSEPQPPWL